MPTQDEINAAKYPTPAPPNDPASLSGARDNPLYIGPTNFSTIQKQYTPYQIEQATTRDASGNIFWKQGVNIADIPTVAPSTAFNAPTSPATPTSNNIETSANSSSANFTQSAAMADFSKAQSAASTNYLTGINQTIDNLLAKQQQMATAAKEKAQAEATGLKDKLAGFMNSTSVQDTLFDTQQKFQVQQTIDALSEVRDRLASAQKALDQGILYEESQPVRMALLTGRSAELKKQGLATISSLQTSAEILQGNLDLARTYAADAVAAVKQDNATKMDALNTLLTMANDDLVSLTKEEKDTIAERMNLLDAESKRIDDKKDQIFDLASKYPSAFVKGGVTFLDTPEQALRKMLPTMSEREIEQYNLDIQKQKADIAKAAKSGSGGTAASGVPSSFDDTLSNALMLAYQNGLSDEDFITGAQDYLGRPLSKKEVDYVKAYFATLPKEQAALSLKDQNESYIQDRLTSGEILRKLNPDGTVTYEKNPDYVAPGEAEKKQYFSEELKKQKAWYNPFTWGW